MITHICLICQDLMYLSCVTEIQYWQIKPSKKGSHTNARMILNVLYIVVLYKHSPFAGLYRNVLSYWKLFEFAIERILAIRNYPEIIFASKKSTWCWVMHVPFHHFCLFLSLSLSLSVSVSFSPSVSVSLWLSLSLCLSFSVSLFFLKPSKEAKKS